MRPHRVRLFSCALSLSLLVACGGSGDSSDGADNGAASGGTSSGGAGKSASGGSGQAGSSQGGSAQGGTTGSAGKSQGGGQAGAAGKAQGGAGGAGQGGKGQAGDGAGGSAGNVAGGNSNGGKAGAGAGGDAGSGGAAAGAGGEAGEGGAAGASAGAGGEGGAAAGAGGAMAGAGGAMAGAAGEGGAAGQGGDAGAGGGAGEGGSAGAGGGTPCGGDPLLGATCDTQQPGACAKGTYVCADGAVVCTQTVQPSAELCNLEDDDCDGAVDEDIAPQTCGLGVCQVTVEGCLNGVVPACTPPAGSPVEACDGVDDSCDGVVDEGCNCLDGQTQPCYSGSPDSKGKGICKEGVQTCVSGQWGLCEGEVTPGLEECNGLDDDCNDQTDEGLPSLSCGLGVCANTVPSCVNGAPQLCNPLPGGPETCNNLDDDCDGQIDENNVCCDPKQRCGDLCCPDGLACSFQKCEVPGAVCVFSDDCPSGQYCDYSLGTTSDPPPPQCVGAQQKTGKCLPRPPVCPVGQDPGDPPTCTTKCEYKPSAPNFQPELKYTWGSAATPSTAADVMMTPIVVQLDDDDCDGKITPRDIPDIVFSTFAGGAYTSPGTLRAISIIKGVVVEKWSVPAAFHAGKQIAGGDIHPNFGSEIVGCLTDGRARAYSATGTVLWTSTTTGCGQPAIADLDQDGKPEVVIEGGILNGETGALKKAFSTPMQGTFAIGDIEGDGSLDIVTSTQAYHFDGTQFATTGVTGHLYSGCSGSYYFCPGPALADLDNDGKAEVIAVYFNQHQLAVWQYDANAANKTKVVRAGIDINGVLNPALCPAGSAGSKWGGGPVTVGDFNSDGTADVALAGGVGYAVFDGNKLMNTGVAGASTFLWAKQTQDCSSAGTGSSLFDFDGDGKAEVVYADEKELRIYEGATGNVLFSACNTSGTLNEYPVIADVDNDGRADVIVASNAYSSLTCTGGGKTAGIRVFSGKNGAWVRTRRIWNQHAYNVVNTNEDGTIPAVPQTNWLVPGLNNFRQNKQPAGEFSAPDLIVSIFPSCVGQYQLTARVRNVGEAPVDAGVKVSFYEGDPASGGVKLGEGVTTNALYPAEAEDVALFLPAIPQDFVYAVIENGAPANDLKECRVDNNVSAASSPACVQ